MSYENELSPAERELETALRSLRPTTARIDPVAAARSAGTRAISARSPLWQVAAAAALAATALGVWTAWERRGELPDRVDRQPSAINDGVADGEWQVAPTSLAFYRQALTKSPADLEAVLDRQTVIESAADRYADTSMLTVWNANLRTAIGEM